MNTTVAFLRPGANGAPEVVVNFGPLTGREATLAEIDRLARRCSRSRRTCGFTPCAPTT